jgi:quinol monooxygenase YgiN
MLKRILGSVSFMLLSAMSVDSSAQATPERYVRVAELKIAPQHMDAFKVAIRESIEAAIQKEPDVLALYAVVEKEQPNLVRVFEIYVSEDAYRRHVQTEHFQKFRRVTDSMVTSRKLVDGIPIILGSK